MKRLVMAIALVLSLTSASDARYPYGHHSYGNYGGYGHSGYGAPSAYINGGFIGPGFYVPYSYRARLPRWVEQQGA